MDENTYRIAVVTRLAVSVCAVVLSIVVASSVVSWHEAGLTAESVRIQAAASAEVAKATRDRAMFESMPHHTVADAPAP